MGYTATPPRPEKNFLITYFEDPKSSLDIKYVRVTLLQESHGGLVVQTAVQWFRLFAGKQVLLLTRPDNPGSPINNLKPITEISLTIEDWK